MPTKRTPIRRGARTRITPEAVAAYQAGDGAALHGLLGLKPWEASPLDAKTWKCPYDDDSTAYAGSWQQARELRGQLEQK